MTNIDLEARQGSTLAIDLCATCKAIWFDHFEALQMAPASTLRVFAIISEQSSAASTALPGVLRCPRCRSRLLHTHDIQRNTPFRYWRCDAGHGRLMTFLDFLRQKDFVRPLSTQQLQELRQNVQTVNCSNCGAAIDLAKDSLCRHCGSAMSMLDLQQMTRTIAQLQAAAAGQPPVEPSATEPSERVAPADMHALILAIQARGGGDDPGRSLITTGLGMLGDLLRKRF